MQNLNEAELEKMRITPLGKKHPVRARLEVLKENEIIKIFRSELKWKNRTPSYFCNQIHKLTAKTFLVYKWEDNKGWVVKRVS